jgi:hypothetical protein
MDDRETERKLSQTDSEVTELKATVRQLLARVDRHAVVIQVLKDMLSSRGDLAEDEFLDRVEQVAAKRAEAKACRKCGRAMSPKHSRCIYCGEARPAELL